MRSYLKLYFFILSLGCLVLNEAAAAAKFNWKKVKVLVYTKNGKGYVHDNIPSAVACVQKLGQEQGFKVEVADNPEIFTEANLKQYTLLLFPSTNNDVFDTDAQRLAFRRYIQAGGGFVGLHSVLGTERNWPWFKMLLGGTFLWHAKYQKFTVKVIDPTHPSMQGLPKVWEKEDECYFSKELYPGTHTLIVHDLSTLDPNETEKVKNAAGPYTTLYPAAWYQKFDGGYIWVTALGHDKKDYQDPTYVRHVLQGIQFVAGQVAKLDFNKAYAASREEAVRY